MTRHGRFDVWIEVDGRRAEEYGEGCSGRITTCYVESWINKDLVIFIKEHKSETSATAKADVYVDSIHVGNVILSTKRESCFPGSWVDKNSLRPFIFTEAQRGDKIWTKDHSDLEDIGKIIVHISEVVIQSKSLLEDQPPKLREWKQEPMLGHDHDTNVGPHRIALSKTPKKRMYSPQYHTFESQPFDQCQSDPIVTFEIIYGPKQSDSNCFLAEFLTKNIQNHVATGSSKCGSMQTAIQIMVELPYLQDLLVLTGSRVRNVHVARKMKLPAQSCDLWMSLGLGSAYRDRAMKKSTNSNRLTNSGGMLKIERIADKAVEKTPARLSSNRKRRREDSLGREIENEKNGHYTSRLRNRDSENDSIHPVYIDESDSEIGELHDNDSNAEEHQSLDGDSSQGQTLSEAILGPVKMDACATTSHAIGDYSHAQKVMKTIQAFSDELMDLAAGGDESGVVSSIAEELVGICDSSSRRLQAFVLQNKKILERKQ
ncbi:hypothetical protein EW145_g1960 [Phellinidium pouzarii]|uniref:Uncharacterized protein n=1 Tax=Phellinidium pouzarii TaxID=167371 RepID=A0A4S4LCJ6_9AGAM|nr:hypothetical protein EW145_g1960 [Phellinidium pouzarii]